MPKKKRSVENTVKNIRRNSRRQYSGEEKIRIVLEGLRGEESVAELCRKEGISQSLYYRWSKEFLEAGKQRLVGNTKREASSEDVKGLRQENEQLKQLVAELALRNRVLKKSVTGLENGWDERCTTLKPRRKMEIIRLVEASDLSIRRTLQELDIPRSSFYRWYQRYQTEGYEGLANRGHQPKQFWNKIPQQVADEVVLLPGRDREAHLECVTGPDRGRLDPRWDE